MLRSNTRTAGLEDHRHFFEGTCVAFTESEEITGVAARYRNGMSFLQAADLVRTAVAASGRDTIIMHEHP